MLPCLFCNPLLSCAENLDVLTDDLHLGTENLDVLTDVLHLDGDGDVLLNALAHQKQNVGHLRVRHQKDQGNRYTPTSLPMVSDDVGIIGYAA